ncbi:DUF2147 domain-containing protein [Sphingomonas sp. VNH70]|uniref:DUF2147 domain-containing protein n=1 Tax=Sphingomonas silueang TaxID=3156617 RepID=UPI0032B54C64
MRRLTVWGAALLLGSGIAPAQASAPGPVGYWIGPHRDVAVRTAPCGQALCGWVAWASDSARAHAAGGGTARLIGTELLHDYVADGDHGWSGTLFVPDLGRSFASHIEQAAPDRLEVRGCILAGLVCRSQVWTRIDRLPGA